MKKLTITAGLISALLFITNCSKEEDKPTPMEEEVVTTPNINPCDPTGNLITVNNTMLFGTWIQDSVYNVTYDAVTGDTLNIVASALNITDEWTEFTNDGRYLIYLLGDSITPKFCYGYAYAVDSIITTAPPIEAEAFERNFVSKLTSTELNVIQDREDLDHGFPTTNEVRNYTELYFRRN